MQVAQVSSGIWAISYSAVASPFLTSKLRIPSKNFVAGSLAALTHSSNVCHRSVSDLATIVFPELLELEFQVGIQVIDHDSFRLREPASLLTQDVDDIPIAKFSDERE